MYAHWMSTVCPDTGCLHCLAETTAYYIQTFIHSFIHWQYLFCIECHAYLRDKHIELHQGDVPLLAAGWNDKNECDCTSGPHLSSRLPSDVVLLTWPRRLLSSRVTSLFHSSILRSTPGLAPLLSPSLSLSRSLSSDFSRRRRTSSGSTRSF